MRKKCLILLYFFKLAESMLTCPAESESIEPFLYDGDEEWQPVSIKVYLKISFNFLL